MASANTATDGGSELTLPISQLSDILSVGNTNIVQAFIGSLTVIFQYNHQDIKDTLQHVSLDHLKRIYRDLCDRVQAKFTEYHGRRPISRQAKRKILPDICTLGHSIANERPHRDLDRIFHLQRKSTITETAVDPDVNTDVIIQNNLDTNILADVLSSVLDLKAKVEKLDALQSKVVSLEEQVSSLRYMISTLIESRDNSSSGDHSDNEDSLSSDSEIDVPGEAIMENFVLSKHQRKRLQKLNRRRARRSNTVKKVTYIH